MAFAIIFGAFGAHYLKNTLSPNHLLTFETGIRYQVYGGLGLFILILLSKFYSVNLRSPVCLLGIGILIFSGTLYFLALRTIMGIEGMAWIGAITPIGGGCMIASWIWTAFIFYKLKTK